MFCRCDICRSAMDIPITYVGDGEVQIEMCQACADLAWEIIDSFTWSTTRCKGGLIALFRREMHRREMKHKPALSVWRSRLQEWAGACGVRGGRPPIHKDSDWDDDWEDAA